MDTEKIKQLMDLASNIYGTSFWKDIFEPGAMNSFMGDGAEKLEALKNMMGSTSPQGQAPEAGQRAYQGSASEPSTAPAPALENTPQFPLADIIKKDGKVIVLIDLPGINKEDVQLMMNRNHLVIKGTPKSKVKESDVEIVLYERKHGPFERRILLPEPTDGSNITAKFHNGVLQVSYPIMEQTGEIIPID